MRTTLAVLHWPEGTMGFLDWLLAAVLTPRGKPIPVGEHLSAEPGFFHDLQRDVVVFSLDTYSADESPVGRFVGTADASTRFVIDDVVVLPDQALERIGEHRGYMRVIVEEPGRVALMSYNTEDPGDG